MNNMFVKSGDTVMVMSGEDKGKTGKVQKAFPSKGKIVVEGVAMVKVHQKPRGQGMQGGIIEKEAAIPACKVMLVCPKCKKPTRVGHKMTEGEKARKVRACKKCGAAFDN
jgi:large subunit ribosomal protein L24